MRDRAPRGGASIGTRVKPFRQLSLQSQVSAIAGLGLLVTILASLSQSTAAVVAIPLVTLTLINVVVAPFSRIRNEIESTTRSLAQRNSTVQRLLEFSQTIGGASKPDQIFASLAHHLRYELNLAGLAILAIEPETSAAPALKASWPESLVRSDRATSEMEIGVCPCLRQCLPRQFKPEGCPVRCSIDQLITLDASHPAFCIPFNIGRKATVLVHMLMSPGRDWSEDHRQLAQTYCNTAQSALVSLNLLAEAERQSMTDALTGLYNRRSMDDLLQREVALAERHGHPLALVMIDMDLFKQINDEHGHAAGDYLLKSFADCVRITLRRTDLAFRYGGDEFVIALPQTTIAQAQQVVNKLRQAFHAVDFSDAIARLKDQPTLSIGVAERCRENNVLTLSALLSAADSALYDAKNANRNCVRVYSASRAA
jgi:diguanylate cyclase (GGDEF)-like protein